MPSIGIPLFVINSGSIILMPPARNKRITIAANHGTKIMYFTKRAFPFLAFFLVTTTQHCCIPAPGQTHEQNARPKRSEDRNCIANKIMLPHRIPYVLAHIIKNGEK